MHPNAKLLTFNPFRQIQGLDTLPQYKGLNELLTRQYSQEEARPFTAITPMASPRPRMRSRHFPA